ncbi:MAG: M48 family metalloprotease [Deltaproteobacteria bacterium]|nr:M48 family metalloprotease [Deltaproteobacteria bacterium]
MAESTNQRPRTPRLYSRRDFLKASALASAGLMAGCAVNPVTGEKQLMLVSEEWEIQVDRQNSPHQFSSDYGTLQDAALSRYIQEVGASMAPHTHRTQMPYSFQGVNATYINAYAFPGGSIAATRGILLSLESEAEFSSLLGHELGHVNARHTAQQMSKGTLIQAIAGGVGAFAGAKGEAYGQLASQISALGAGALLASYSRDNERQADYLGMTYMTKTGYGTEGFVQLMTMLNSLNKGSSNAVSLLFATHPMSQERYNTAVSLANSEFSSSKGKKLSRERYMDNTANLRRLKPAIENFQKAEEYMAAESYDKAETSFKAGLKTAPSDYAGLLMMAKCQYAKKKYNEAIIYSEQAKNAYPKEAQSNYISGLSRVQLKKYDQAVADFTGYESKLPGNPNTIFYRGYAYEGMGNKQKSAEDYSGYLKQVTEGEQAEHAYQRLVEWGVIKESAQ